jgi:trans-aconitate methyltransferase
MDDVIKSQIEYYRERAPEYDRWWQDSWGNNADPRVKGLWDDDVATVAAALDAFNPTGKVLELACGTGWWTQSLARYATSLECVDASKETMEIASTRAPDARFIQADLFDWEPDDTYDVVFFSFWLSHVPHDRFEWFWSLVDRALVPGGRVFLIDNLGRPTEDLERMAKFLQRDTSTDGVVTRKLYDGREFRAVKVYYEEKDLERRLAALGWDFEIHGTKAFFYYGSGQRG